MPYRVSNLITAPVREPLTLAEAKLHLRVDDDVTADDALIAGLIVAARQMVEGYTHRVLITQTWESRFNGFSYSLWLPHPPLQSVTSITYVDGGSPTLTTVAATVYDVDLFSSFGRVYLKYSQTWPTPQDEEQSVRVRFVSGYGNFGSDVPQPIRQAMLLMVSDMYENRETVVVGASVNPIPMSATVEALIGPYRMAMP